MCQAPKVGVKTQAMLSFHGSKADKHELHLITAVSDVALKKISAKYSCEAVEVAPDEAHGSPKVPGFASAVKAATKSAFFGFSVVGGLKEKVLALVDSTEPVSPTVGAACEDGISSVFSSCTLNSPSFPDPEPAAVV